MDTQTNTETANREEKPGFDTITDLAARMQCTERTVQNWMRERKIPYVKIGRSVRFDWDKVREHLNARGMN